MNTPSNTSELIDLLDDEELKSKIKIVDESPIQFRYKKMIMSFQNVGTGRLQYESDFIPHISFGKDLKPIKGEDTKELLLRALRKVDEHHENNES